MSIIKKLAGVLALLLAFSGAATAQNVEELYSPYFLSYGPSTVSFMSPMNSIFNPAAGGLKQRATVELNWITLLGLGTDTGWGNAINAGLCIPTNAGVWTTSLHFTGLPFASTNIGTRFTLHTSFAKDLYPNFLIGVGLNAAAGAQSNIWDWELGGSLGFTHIIPELIFMKDFTWGVAMRGMGKGYNPTGVNYYYPKAFTPAVGLSFKPVKLKDFYWTINADFSVPGFSGIRFTAATELGILDTIFIRAKFEYDSLEAQNLAAVRSLPMGFGLGVVFKTDIKDDVGFLNISERGWGQSDFQVDAAYAPLANGVHAMGLGANISLGVADTSPPVITAKVEKTTYMSPNFDGTQDELVIPVDIKDQRYITGYKLTVKDSSGRTVREIANKESRPENVSVESVFQRLVYVRSGINVPPTLVWDGKSDSGTLVPDGSYTYTIEAWDDNNNKAVSEARTIVVKTAPPKASVSAAYLIFSPGREGDRQTLPITITGTKEDLWELTLVDDKGKKVFTKEWRDAAPSSFSWDGKTAGGEPAPDGVYTLTLASADKAGNKASYELDNIIVDTKETNAFVTLGSDGLSPNGAEKFKTITAYVKVSYQEGIKDWSFVISHEGAGAQKTLKGQDGTPIPATVTWDGLSDSGAQAPDGTYTARIKVEYDRGTSLEATSRNFVLNAAGPTVDVALSPVPFSPDNDGVEDELSIGTTVKDLSPVASWKMEITDPTGVHFTSFSGVGTPKETIIWDGKSDKGEYVEAASDYKLELTLTDTLGCTASLSKVIMVDILVYRDGDKLRIRVPSITFKANSDDYVDVAKEAFEKNQWTLGRLAKCFNKYASYNILIEGHAVSVYYADPARAKKEQEEELLPLSKKRAEAIKRALSSLGIASSRISTEGVGAARPIVPFSDLVNRWKDRRVEFILIKN